MKTCKNLMLCVVATHASAALCSESSLKSLEFYNQNTKASLAVHTSNKERLSDENKEQIVIITSLLHALMQNEITVTSNQIICFPHYKTSSDALMNTLTFIDFKQNIAEMLRRIKTVEPINPDDPSSLEKDFSMAAHMFERFTSGTDLVTLSEKKKSRLQANRSVLLSSVKQGSLEELESAIKLPVQFGKLTNSSKTRRCSVQ